MKSNARIILTVLLLGMLSFCSMFINPALADLVDDGKALLLEDYDLYGADAKFAEALTLNAADLRANFWRALTIGMTNPDFKAELTRLGFLDAGSSLPLDAEHEFMLGYSKVDTMIIDNTDTGAGYSEEGDGWVTSSDESSYGDSCRAHTPGTGTNKAIWTFTITTAGEYDVALWWPHMDSNSTGSSFTVYYDGGNQTIVRTQQGNGCSWQHIGRFHFSPGADARVELSDNTVTGNVVADAVKLEFNEIFLDADTTHASFSGSWTDVVYGYAKNGSYREIVAGSGGSCTWTLPVVLSGRYHLDGRWFAHDAAATDAVFEIRVNGSLVSSIPVDQRHNNLDSVSLGLFEFQAEDTNTVTLLQNSSGNVTSDGISIIPIYTFTDLTQFQGIQSSSLTQLDQALSCLNNVTGAFADTADFHATDDLGNPVITELDYGDALMLKAVLNLYKSEMCRLAAYNFDNVDAHKLGASYSGLFSVNSLLSSYPNLLNLSGGASSYMATAKQSVISSVGAYYDAYDFITAEGDNQEDDFVTFDPNYQDGASEALHPILDKIVSNLNGSTSYFFVTPEDFGSEPDESYFNTKINYRAYYDNPTGLRSLLPEFDSDDFVLRSTAPDPMLGGILPDLKQEDYNGMAKLGSRLFQPTVNWSGDSFSISLNWKLDTYADFARYKIFRSTTATVDEASTLVYDSTNKDTLTVTDSSVDQNQSIYYYRLYTYYSDGDKSASLMRRVISKIYVNINNSTGNEDGTKQYPLSDLGDAIDDYGTSGAKIIVAQGTYLESETSMHLSNKSGLIIEGGYEPVNWARNIQTYATIIDGTGRGGWGVIGLYNQSNIGIDGFTVMGDQVNVINLSNATLISIKNCTIRNSSQVGIGAWSRSSLTVEDCIITQNQSDGIRISDGVSLTLKRSNIIDNNGSGLNLENATANKWYEVYGGNTYISGPDGYDPASHGYTFLGADIFTQTYTGTYGYYIIRTPSGNPVMVDTAQGSSGSYYATYTTGNTSEYWNVGGAPDGAYATVGNNDYNYPGGYIVIDPPDGNTSLKVFVVDAPEISCPITIENNVITGNNSYGIRLRNTLGQASIKNNLIVDNDIFGIGGDGKDKPTILNNTIKDNGSWGIAFSSGSSSYGSYIAPVIKNNIITGQSIEIHFENSAATPVIDYNDVFSSTSSYSGCSAGAHDINADPFFTIGNPKGDYYLSQIPAGQAVTSACVDSGSDTSASQGLDEMTTRTDDYSDTGTVDMGYHYASEGIIVDNTDSAHTSRVGSWTVSTNTAGYYGTNYEYRTAGTGVNKFTWSPVVSA
ncbi:MAG: right-handed parallel beta-helix repeat-containing protein, partial [Candidatus Omnitrophota bacterium]